MKDRSTTGQTCIITGAASGMGRFAAHVLDNYPAIHVLINNARLTNPEYIPNSEGHEQHMAIMHLGHYLLIHMLLDRLQASAPARIVQISSDAHKAGPGIFVGTNVFRHMRGIMKLGIRLVRPLFSDPERAARTHVFLASSPDVAGISGKYWEHCREKPASPLAHDRMARARLIAYTENAPGRWISPGLGSPPRGRAATHGR